MAQPRTMENLSYSLPRAADRTVELEKTATGQDGSWGSWLTGWTSWGGYEGESAEQGSKNIGPSGKVTFQEPVSAEEEEFLGELAEVGNDDSLFKRDHVFVQLNFKLNSGKLQVKTTSYPEGCVPVAELEFSEVHWMSEMRPKMNSWQFSTTLGALFLRDLYNKKTLFPVLVQAQDKPNDGKIIQGQQQNGDVLSGLGSLIEEKPPLLEISFEQKPGGLRELHRGSVAKL
eukprot:Seg440.2 transcript_id=Seg440.2/GoldUCD/mRNA.D3Y31 product="Vacuolar protein sorting-associated protein 13D" protein_id=Seg440.2/GoldUCD/D3Y31